MARPAYATGAGFVVHKSGARLTAAACDRVRQYLVKEIGNPSWSRESTASREADLAALNDAVAATWPRQAAAE